MDEKKYKRIKMIGAGLGCAYVSLKALALVTRERADVDEDNPYLFTEFHSGFAASKREETIYERFVKPNLDSALSFCGMIALFPIYAVTAAAVYLDDPGPVFFTQKRIGKDKHYFMLHKFRTMRMDAPHDVPTHMLDSPEQYITRVGRRIRRYSVDELPQLLDCFRKKISLVGPRPALWNQADLVAEREKYGANSVMPGITGLAQVSGRDELEIPEKARLDGEYVKKLSFGTDVKCLMDTVRAVLRSDGVVEGGTGAKKSAQSQIPLRPGVPEHDPEPDWGFKKQFNIDFSLHKRVLITGAGSYIGEYFQRYAQEHYGSNFTIDTLDMIGDAWREHDFSNYDCVFHVAGIAHADVGKVDDATKEQYFRVNTDLAIEAANKAKTSGVKQFIFMSSMIVYGGAEYIDENTVPAPANFYGDSKWQADKGVRALADDSFHVAVLRPPMVYGRGSKGNYSKLAKLAKMTPVFPAVENRRSMLYIENLCEFLCLLMLSGEGGVYMPQNAEYTNTSKMVREIALNADSRVRTTGLLNPLVQIGNNTPGKISVLLSKVFGNSIYDQRISQYQGMSYFKVSLRDSVRITVGQGFTKKKPRVLMLASVASMIDQFNRSNINLLLELGYDVDVACNFINGNTCSDERISELKSDLAKQNVRYYQVDFTRSVVDFRQDTVAYRQVKELLYKNQYAFIHCHSPVGGVIGRICAKQCGTKVIYTAHGFHFYRGAPKKNWIIYYPIEKALSRWTDVLITINQEDYRRALKHFHAQRTVYIPGVGLDTNHFAACKVDRNKKRKELGVGADDFLLLSVGELSERKNQIVVIEALGELKKRKELGNIVYLAVGVGDMKDAFIRKIQEYGLENHVKLLGYRTDIDELCKAVDCFIHPSIREGLGIAPLEAMAAGLPLISANVNGINVLERVRYPALCNKAPKIAA